MREDIKSGPDVLFTAKREGGVQKLSLCFWHMVRDGAPSQCHKIPFSLRHQVSVLRRSPKLLEDLIFVWIDLAVDCQ